MSLLDYAPFQCRVTITIRCDRCAKTAIVVDQRMQFGEVLPLFTLPPSWGRTQYGQYECIACPDHLIEIKDIPDLIEMREIVKQRQGETEQEFVYATSEHASDCMVTVMRNVQTLPDPVVCTCTVPPLEVDIRGSTQARYHAEY